MTTNLPAQRVVPFDIIGIGFGPSNLSLAVCARESDPSLTCLFLEKNPRFLWHPGMLLDGTRMQISFLKDLASMRNLASPYTFLQYTKARGRLEHFINLNEFRPTRLEYYDYLSWVAQDFSDQVRYSTAVTRMTPVQGSTGGEASLFRIEVRNVITEEPSVYFARNVVYAAGGKPRISAGEICQAPGVVHSSEFLHRFPTHFTARDRPYVFVVAGAGQSAGEVVAYLLDRYERAQVHLLISGYAPRPTDNSPFANEQFYSHSADAFYRFGQEKRTALSKELRDTNYGVIREDLLDHLYRTAYLDEVKGTRRLFIHPCSRLARVREDHSGLRATIHDRFGGPSEELLCDGVVLATGYARDLNSEMFADVLPLICKDESGKVALSRNYRVRTAPGLSAGLYVQGYGESSFGLGDTLLSMLPFRSQEIFADICACTPKDAPLSEPRLPCDKYPPKGYLEDDPDKLYAVMERFSFATLVSARGPDEPVVTQVPLTLDRTRGAQGVLFGHMDRANPHTELLDGHSLLVLFHGPNAYISSQVYQTDQLPTWNSITVRVRGKVTVIQDRAELVRGLCGIAERAGHGERLEAYDPRIDELINLIVGFEIEIEEMVGRFKLSQDKSDPDRWRAALALAGRTETGERALIEYAVGLSLTADGLLLTADSPQPVLNGARHQYPVGDAHE
jgi:L-ornithine N5-monooxygenase